MNKIAIVTFGCSLNQSDSEMMLGLLKQNNFNIVDNPEQADLVIINSCTVKNLAEKKLFKAIEDYKAKGKKLLIAGCVAQAEQEYLSTKLRDQSVIGTKQIANIHHIVQETLNGNTIHMIDMDCDKRVCVPIVRHNPVVGIVPLAEGCIGDCTYCKTRFARGKLISYSPGAIVQRVRSDIQQGCKEIWLTSQDCGAYGYDIADNLPNLLKAVLKIDTDEKFKVRLGMANPQHILKWLPQITQIYKDHATEDGNLFNFIHLPIQSGDNEVLKSMNRRYTVEEFKKIVTTLREAVPTISIATDIIVGFPGETEEQFQNTIDVVKELQFDVINISRFWPRPGTPAATMPNQVHGNVSKERSQLLRQHKAKSTEARNLLWKDWEGEVIIDEKGPTGGWIGRNYAYKPIAVQSEEKLGNIIKVKIKKTMPHHLEA